VRRKDQILGTLDLQVVNHQVPFFLKMVANLLIKRCQVHNHGGGNDAVTFQSSLLCLSHVHAYLPFAFLLSKGINQARTTTFHDITVVYLLLEVPDVALFCLEFEAEVF